MRSRGRYSWKDWLPADVMGDLRNARELEGDWVSREKERVPKLSGKGRREARLALKRAERDLRARIRAGKKWITQRWPGWWTPEVQKDFEEWL